MLRVPTIQLYPYQLYNCFLNQLRRKIYRYTVFYYYMTVSTGVL